jgi:hypothetical protein
MDSLAVRGPHLASTDRAAPQGPEPLDLRKETERIFEVFDYLERRHQSEGLVTERKLFSVPLQYSWANRKVLCAKIQRVRAAVYPKYLESFALFKDAEPVSSTAPDVENPSTLRET